MSTELEERHAILDEHRQVMLLVARVDECACADVRRDKAWGTDLAGRVGGLLAQLELHFSGDVEVSMFEELAQSAPHLIGKLEALVAEHPQILADFRKVAETAVEVDLTDSDAGVRLAMMARKAIARLRRHEAEENEIIIRAIWEDIGAGG